ncbi:phage Gp37/Gp68 family protein [Nocardia sp. BSTN01]|uniref:DUF5131 family protein n=1 Tax=Nocardia sp. BSTN01 TaxID=2783665 RepID=UPI00188FE354|nr:phage Gp37/Gp68 family protein [Nocardia sp. BSTN01]MBF5002375.1 phage Gp37/Gp68 family protein [Nocardia sp. BSTN01]
MGTHIEWTDETWNPVTGCTRVSEGCEHCYIEHQPPMRMARRRFNGPQIGATTGVQLHPERLGKPLEWRKPQRIFVCSMADLFHDDVPDEYIAQVFATMAVSERHTFQVLTKRPARMRSLLSSQSFPELVTVWAWRIDPGAASRLPKGGGKFSPNAVAWPLPNVWLGVSTETQQWADTRIPQLLATPAAVRFISAEPLLEPVDLDKHLYPHRCPDGCHCRRPDDGDRFECACGGACADWSPRAALDWVIVGGESGPKARPMELHWAQELRDQCIGAGVPYLFKQWGEWAPDYATSDPILDHPMRRVGKKAAGRELDGRTWDEYPPKFDAEAAERAAVEAQHHGPLFEIDEVNGGA